MEPTLLIEKLAEYLAIAPNLNAADSPETYARANQLAYELAVWLPADLYLHMVTAIAEPGPDRNPRTVILAAREKFNPGDPFDPNRIIHHFPNARKL